MPRNIRRANMGVMEDTQGNEILLPEDLTEHAETRHGDDSNNTLNSAPSG